MDHHEIWRDVPSINGVEASSNGCVRVKTFYWPGPRGGVRPYGGKTIIGFWDGKRLTWNFRGTTYKIARLVCEAFNGSAPFAKAVCMHIDENPRNNRPDNLQWGSQRENLNAPGFKAYCRSRVGSLNPRVKARHNREAA